MRRLILFILPGVLLWALVTEAGAQGGRRSAPPSSAGEQETRQVPTPPDALVHVMQTIDLSAQLGSEENLLTLDGEPLPPMLTRNVTLGLVIDDAGHVVTRLVGITPSNLPREIKVTPQRGQPKDARFIGLDAATGICVLQVEGPDFRPPARTARETLESPLSVHLFGFNAALVQSQSPSMGFFRPRIHFFPARIARAVGDFRYQRQQPLYRLLTPHLTPIQDGSLVVAPDGAVFGIAVHDISEGGDNIVYPMARVQQIAAAVLDARGSLAHGWLGATGVTINASPRATAKAAQNDIGVRVTGVFPDSPAEEAGIRTEDVLLAINDRAIASVEQLSGTLRQLAANSEVTLRVRRGREYKTLQAKLAPAPALESGQQLAVLARRLRSWEEKLRSLGPADPERREIEPKVTAMRAIMDNILRPAPVEVKLRVRYGIEVHPLTTQLMRYFAVPGGVLVTAVAEGSRAARAGLRAGDVIISIGAIRAAGPDVPAGPAAPTGPAGTAGAAAAAERPVADASTLLQALDEKDDAPFSLTISRQREQSTIPFTTPN